MYKTMACIIRAVATQWNTMVKLIGHALELCKVLMLLVGLEQHNRGHGTRLSQFKLSKQEWEVLTQLHPLLEVHCLLAHSIHDLIVS